MKKRYKMWHLTVQGALQDRHGAAHCVPGPWEVGQALRTLDLHPGDSREPQCEKDRCHGVALSWSEKRDNINFLAWFWLQRRVNQPSVAETSFQHLEAINCRIPKGQDAAFSLLLINLQISLLAHKEHHALIKPSCFMGRATRKSVDFRYQKEISYLRFIQLALIAPGGCKSWEHVQSQRVKHFY